MAGFWGWAVAGAAVAGVVLTVISLAQATPLRRTPRIISFSDVRPTPAVLRRKPGRIVYSGDGSALLAGTGSTFKHLVWTTWTGTEGRARGADWHDNCKPDCADGRFTAYPTTVRVYRPRRVAGKLLFTRMTTTYTGARPPYPGYHHRAVTYTLGHDAKFNTLFWSLP